MPPLVVIVGETASGKSALALELAEQFNGELICADSWTVYKGFDIGTAKPSAADRARVPHHLLDVADPREGFSAPKFQRLADQAITEITSRIRLPILVGGTGLYVDSVLFNYSFLPPSNPALRAELNELSLDELCTRVNNLGLDADGIDMRNKRRVIRLIENAGVRPTKHAMRENTIVLGVNVPRDELKTRVAKRVDTMLANGLEREVRELSKRYGWDVEPMKGIGYREWREYFGDGATQNRAAGGGEHVRNRADLDAQSAGALRNAGTQTLDQTRERIVSATMGLAKRQRTWFKRNSSIQWVSDRSNTVDIVTTFLNKSD